MKKGIVFIYIAMIVSAKFIHFFSQSRDNFLATSAPEIKICTGQV